MSDKEQSLRRFSRGLNAVLQYYLSHSSPRGILGGFHRWWKGRSIERLVAEVVEAGRLLDNHRKTASSSIDLEALIVDGYKVFAEEVAMHQAAHVSTIAPAAKRWSEQQFPGIAGEEQVLRDLFELLERNASLFSLGLLAGSIGSREIKFGWSDVDLFLILGADSLRNVAGLRHIRSVAIEVTRCCYAYNILQLHDAFYATYHDYAFMLERYLPRASLATGLTGLLREPVTVHWACSRGDAHDYFETEVAQGFSQLWVSPKRSVLAIVMLFHRMYSFPFAFLGAQGLAIGKKEAFAKIEEWSGLFPGISRFYGELNRYYHEWEIASLYTVAVRRHLSRFEDARMLNRIMLPLERELVARVRANFAQACSKGLFDQFQSYVERARVHLQRGKDCAHR